MSRWKHTYDVGDVKSSTRAGIFSHDLEEREEYPSETIQYALELYTSEIKLMQSLYSNAVKLDELGTLEAWVDEMRKIATVASNFDRVKDTIRRPSKMRRLLDFDILNKIVYPCGMGKFLSDFVIFNKVVLPQGSRRFLSDFDRLKDKIAQLSEIGIAYGIELAPNLPHDIVYQIKTKLLSAHPCTIPVLGMTHKHKEALQDLVECDNAIAHHFDMHAWVYVPEDINAASILEYVANQVLEQGRALLLEEEEELTSLSEFPTEKELMQDIFIRKRCLVVVDEIRTIEVWDVLMGALRRISTGSRIILIGNEHTYSLLDSNSSITSDISVIVRQLPQKRRDVNTPDMVNVRGLPSYLRQCLYYFVLFPAKFKVPVRRLIVMWVLEGLVRSTSKGNENKSAEQVAEGYLKELIDEGLVLVTKEKLNGKPKACQLKHGTRETLLEIAKEASFFQDSNGITSRLVDHHDSSDSCFIKIHGNPSSSASVSNYKKVVSFLSFDATEGSKPGEDIGAFLRSCTLAKCFESLRILDLERVFRPQLPKELSELTLLRYLGLRWTYLETLPINITNLINLQMLDMKHTYINVLPKSIWKMRNLRHLYLSENYRTRFSDGPLEISLNDLQTLWGAFIDEDTLVKGGLDTSLNIQKLGLSCMSNSGKTAEHLKDVARWISNLQFLESLRLKSRDEDGKAAELHLETLETNENLSTVYLLGKLEPSVVEKFPVNLIEITLSGSELKDDPMEYLKSLPKLLILRLLSQSVVSRKMTCSRGGFAKLKLFYIWKLENLEELEVEEGALPSLEDLEIRSCENLTQLPRVENLKKFTLTRMPVTFINKCKEQQPELWDKLQAVLEVDAE
ncbi:hypothetical protein ACP275_07G094800 [Erythranthe tilingii]